VVNRDARQAVRAWVQVAVETALGSMDELVGCTEAEIRELAAVQGRSSFPAAFDEYLRLCGQKDGVVGDVLNPAMISDWVLREIVSRAEQTLAIAGLDAAPWHGCVLFADSTDGTVYWMGDDVADPAVGYLVENGEVGSLPSFTAYLEKALSAWTAGQAAWAEHTRRQQRD
jgi:hypothetical protein